MLYDVLSLPGQKTKNSQMLRIRPGPELLQIDSSLLLSAIALIGTRRHVVQCLPRPLPTSLAAQESELAQPGVACCKKDVALIRYLQVQSGERTVQNAGSSPPPRALHTGWRSSHVFLPFFLRRN